MAARDPDFPEPAVTRLLCALLFVAFGLPAIAADGMKSIFLVAKKGMADPFFRGSVVLVTHHGGGAPLGVIVNRPTEVSLATVFSDMESLATRPDAKVFFGGPVARDRLVFVFRAKEAPKGAVALFEDVYLGYNRSLLLELLGREQPVEGLRVFAGYASWAPGQLENEVARGDWHLAAADGATIFDKAPDEVWPELERRASAQRVRHAAPPRRPPRARARAPRAARRIPKAPTAART